MMAQKPKTFNSGLGWTENLQQWVGVDRESATGEMWGWTENLQQWAGVDRICNSGLGWTESATVGWGRDGGGGGR